MEYIPTILIVDDDSTNLRLLGKLLKENNYNVAVAKSGKDALDIVYSEELDLIMLDVMMPEMDGYELCKIIKSQPEYQEIPILYLSALNEIDEIIKGFSHGAVDFINKPFNTKILLSRVKTHIDLRLKTKKIKNFNKELEQKVIERTEELNKANQELMQLDELKSEFLNIISHEIRTPLNGIMGAFFLIKSRVENNNLDKIFEVLELSVERLERFTLNALLITNLKSGRHKLELTKFKLIDLLNKVSTKFNDKLKEKEIEIRPNIDNKTILIAEWALVEKCIASLIDNAIKFSPQKSTIEIKVVETVEIIVCQIIDNGHGFTPKSLKRLFQPFAPGHQFIDQNEGIELALCKLIMEKHKGRIEVENYSNGAMVSLTFNKIIE